MKVLIVTYYWGANYGAFWQAFALGDYLKSCGAEVSYLKDEAMEKQSNEQDNKYEHNLKILLKQQVESNFCMTSVRDGYDLIVLGSDEIWNSVSIKNKDRQQYWGTRLKGKKMISYAPTSAGASWKRLLIKWFQLKKLDAISVRDKSTQNALNKIGFENIEIVLDPTFLIDYSNFNSKRLIECDYIFVYSYNIKNEDIELIKTFARENDYKIVVSGCQAKWADYNPVVTPVEWLGLFKFASLIFTTTFHGTVFSLIFQKDFYFIGRNIKAIELLKLLGVNVENEKTLIKKENYVEINKNKNELQSKSLRYIYRFCKLDLPTLYEKNNECCGCAACFAICPQSAIIMSQDSEGFSYPIINAYKCIRCRKCIQVCPCK